MTCENSARRRHKMSTMSLSSGAGFNYDISATASGNLYRILNVGGAMGRGPLFSGVGAHPRASKPVHDSRNCLQSGGPRRSRIRNGADSVQSGTTVIGTGIVDGITLFQAIVRIVVRAAGPPPASPSVSCRLRPVMGANRQPAPRNHPADGTAQANQTIRLYMDGRSTVFAPTTTDAGNTYQPSGIVSLEPYLQLRAVRRGCIRVSKASAGCRSSHQWRMAEPIY
jgi:hypothetical protein